MARIRSFNLDRWSEPDEQRRVRHIGMADARETFEKLKKHLEATGLLPDEYFLFDGEYETQLKGELPNFDHALCVPNYGASEGIYLDISLVCRNEDGSRKFIPFATGKTLEESGDAFLRMHRIAGECSLLLNGRGIYFERSETPLFLTSEETDAVINALELEILSDISPEQARLLEGVMGKIDGQRLTPVCAVACHGVDDYSLWTADLPVAVVQEIARDGSKVHGRPEDLMAQMAPDTATKGSRFWVASIRSKAWTKSIPDTSTRLGTIRFKYTLSALIPVPMAVPPMLRNRISSMALSIRLISRSTATE